MTLTEAKKELEKFVELKTTMRPAFVDVLLQAEEVVRCKDCKYADSFSECRFVSWYNNKDDFCSRGERREDGKND